MTPKQQSIESRPSPAMAIPRRTTPDELVEFLRQETKRGALRFELHERSLASGMALPIDTYESDRVRDAQAIADEIFARASKEHQAFALVGTNAYQVRSFLDDKPHASITFRVMAADGMAETRGGEGPHALDVVKQTMRHLEEREVSQQALTLEAISACHMVGVDNVAAFKEILSLALQGSKHTYDQLEQTLNAVRDENVRLRADNSRLFERALEMSVLHEELLSKKHERDLESERFKRDADRKDKAFQGIIVEKLIPAFAMKFGLLPKPGESAAAPAKPTAVTLAPGQIHAIGRFLYYVLEHPDDLLAMRAAISPPAQELLDALVLSFQSETAAPTNGVAATANGAAS